MKEFFGVLSFILSFGATIPYANDVLKGRAKPARSTRVLFLLLITLTFIVQYRAFTSGVLFLTLGELATQLILFTLSIKRGIGGLARLDIICYLGFIVSLSAYLISRNASLSITLLVLTDSIAFLPTLIKIWRDPTSDTWLFFVVGGMAAAAASFLARNSNHYVEILFPIYIFIANALAALPILLNLNKTKTKKQPNSS